MTCVSFILKKGPRHWWESARRAYDITKNPMGWDRFKETFYDKYFPTPLKGDKEVEFIQLPQGSMTVLEYERKFEELMIFAPYLVDTKEHKARRFGRGLRAKIRKAIEIPELPTYGVVLRKGKILDKTEKPVVVAETKDKGQSSALKRPWNMKGYDNRNRGGKKTKVGGIENWGIPTCDTCGKNHGELAIRRLGPSVERLDISYKTAQMLEKIKGEHIRIEGYKNEFTP